MAIGHTVQGAIKTRCDGQLYLIDTGISAYYNNLPSYLDIHYGKVTAKYPTFHKRTNANRRIHYFSYANLIGLTTSETFAMSQHALFR